MPFFSLIKTVLPLHDQCNRERNITFVFKVLKKYKLDNTPIIRRNHFFSEHLAPIVGTLALLASTSTMAAFEQATPASVSGSAGYTDSYKIENLVNNSGLSGSAPNQTSGYSYGGTWMKSGTTGTLTFDMGGVYQIDKMELWIYSHYSHSSRNRAAKDIKISYSMDDLSYTVDQTITGPQNTSGNNDPVPKQEFALTTTQTARYIKLDVLNSHGGGYVGLNEVKFNAQKMSPDGVPTVTGTYQEGETLTGSYTYSDAQGDAESGTSTIWQRADDDAGTGAADIATTDHSNVTAPGTDTYVVAAADNGKYVRYCVTPSDGTYTDPQTCTDWTAVFISQTISFSPTTTGTYGGTQTLSATATSSLDVSFASTTTSVCTVTGTPATTLTYVSAGTCTVTADQAGNSTYAAAPQVSTDITVAKVDITAAADDKSRGFGEANPALTLTYTGLINSDTAADIDTAPTLATTASATTAVGSEAITCTGGSDANYNITSCADGTLTITNVSTTTTIDSYAPTPAAVGQAVTFNFTVTPTSGSNPTGLVTISDGAGSNCTHTLVDSDAGSASCNISYSSAGTYNMNASYAGDANFNTSSTATSVTQQVNTATVVATMNSSATEGGADGNYTVALSSVPSGNVEVTLTPDSQCIVTSSNPVTFSDVSTKTVTVQAVDDDVVEGTHTCQISHTITVGDGGEYVTNMSLTNAVVTIVDNNHGVVVTSNNTSITEGNSTTFDVVLSVEPTASVTVTIAANTQLSLDSETLTFTSGDWDTAQTVTVTAVDDSNVESNHSSSITITSSSADANYEGGTVIVDAAETDKLTINIADNDVASSEESTSSGPPADRYQLSVAGSQAHIKSNPSGIDCEYGSGTCAKLFDRGARVELELVGIKTAHGLSAEDYNITWFGDSDCKDLVVRMHDSVTCAVRVQGKPGVDYSGGNATENDTINNPVTNQLEFLNFSGHSSLRGGAEDIFLGFILEGSGTADVILHADVLDNGVLPQLDFNEVIVSNQGVYGQLLNRRQQSESFILEQTVGEGIYTIQMSSVGTKGRGQAAITLKNNQLKLSSLSIRGYLKDYLVLNFIVGGEGAQKVHVKPLILSGNVVTELHLLNLITQQALISETTGDGATTEVSAGAYAILLKVVEGEGVGMIGIDLVD
ncbi:Ig-like domain repeat protein [Candidatus Albibeggiatoa sp. nov. NOAA]|uniref:MBG domain-containing protein n=1 Tax=Candidatus Albibeggiatoa sp. nov. NOAA TaxID=3162724 RepID=UPI0032FE1804|nr:Ig-like domain repeat protein [Thiotrichaceae bacterium]